MAEEGIGRGDVDVSMATSGGDGMARLSREAVGQADEGDVSEKNIYIEFEERLSKWVKETFCQ
jgi:hypothetical protein